LYAFVSFSAEKACFLVQLMIVSEGSVSKILSVLSHPLRRRILFYLNEKTECTFTDLATEFNVDTGRLSFHLRSLEAFIEQTPTGKYRLSKAGKNAIILIKDLESWAPEAEKPTRPFMQSLSSWQWRVAAFLLDFIIAFVLFLALPNFFYPFSFEQLLLNVNLILFLVLFWIYSTLLEGFSGQTIGKLVLHIKAVRIDGEKISYDEAAVRNFGKVFLLPIDLAIGWRLKDKRYLRYFDKFAGTTVIDLKFLAPPSS
jgi:uncharacterized RDD family membrane protein YckC/DNA-binding transcriptional ArsR family regulator